MAECELCHKSPTKGGAAIFRVNAPGEEPGIWRCLACLTPEEQRTHHETIVFLSDAGLLNPS